MESLLRVRTCLNGMNPVMIRRRVVGVLFEDCLQNRQGFPVGGARLAVVIVAIGERIRKKYSRLHVLGIALDELAVKAAPLYECALLLTYVVRFFSKVGGAGFNVQTLALAGVALEADRLL